MDPAFDPLTATVVVTADAGTLWPVIHLFFFYLSFLVITPWRPGARNTIHALDPATVSSLCLVLVCLSHHGGSYHRKRVMFSSIIWCA
jgi:hypothetical protein